MLRRWMIRALVAVGMAAVPVAAWAATAGMAATGCCPGCPCCG